MIQKFIYGNPIETEAVLTQFPASTGTLPYFTITRTKENVLRFTCPLAEDDIVYGLGENMRGINKRGFHYTSSCVDDPMHTEGKTSLYGAHNFLVVDGNPCFGIFVDFPGVISFDVSYTYYDKLIIEPTENNVVLYIIDGESPLDIIRQFRSIIGRSYIPPRWAFGYQQSRWGYKNAKDILEVADQYQNNHYPLESIFLDIDYMDRLKDFTVDPKRFPNFAEFVQKMKDRNLHLVPIIDAGVKIEEGYSIYDEGVEKGHFCKRADGSNFVAAVWPGDTHFPDVLNKDAREWFGSKYDILISQGIDGFWNDMNEPAIFYSKESMDELDAMIKDYCDPNSNRTNFFDIKEACKAMSGNPKDFKRFYHNMDGKMVRHDRVHNLFGYNMTRAAGEAFDKICPNKRLLMFSRSSYIGMHRYGGIWTGDNNSWWSHLLLNIKMMPSLNMCGFLYSGADIGGFGENTSRDLMLRWLAFGLFTPLMRNHSAIYTRDQEIYRFEEPEKFAAILELRYRLLPYLYSEFVKAALNDSLYFSPLGLVFPEDAHAKRVEDQLFVGESIMIAPVYEQNARGRYVYLPEAMRYIRFSSATEYTSEVLPAGHHYIDVALHEVPIFIREHHILPLADVAENSATLNTDKLTLLTFGQGESSYTLYEDDGYGKDFTKPEHFKTIKVTTEGIDTTTVEDAGKEFVFG